MDRPEFIVVRLHGGMCNQMFEYAFGRGLSEKLGCGLYFDDAGVLENRKAHVKYALGDFDTKVKLASKEMISSVLTPHFYLKRKLYKAFRIPFRYADTHLVEKSFGYDSSFEKIAKNSYFEGLWQSPKYFENIAEKIRKEFRLKREDELKKHPLYGEIVASNSVAVHVRRGDYIKNRRYAKILYVCKQGYYRRAAEYMRSKLANPKFFVCSDDPKWVEQNLDLGGDFTLVKSNSHFEDFFLMQSCKHNIISNSTFSWWSAWLNANPEKIVACPDRWFTEVSKNDGTSIEPDDWVKISTRE